MNELEIRNSVAEILDASPEVLTEASELQSFAAYDSTARLSLMVCLSDLGDSIYEFSELRELRTYGDILKLVGKTSENGQGS